jgi:site-specific DNA recombinase
VKSGIIPWVQMTLTRPTVLALPRHVIGYIRVSSDEQHLSVEAQHADLEQWCCARGVPLIAVYTDVGMSGGAPLEKRPGLLAALSALTRGGALLVVRRDRLARDTFAAAMAERLARKAGAMILTVSGAGDGCTPEALLMRTIIDAFAQYERALIALRTKAGLARKRAHGERVGEVPYGKQLAPDGVHLIDHPVEQAVIATVCALRGDGLSYRAIAAAVNRRGMTNRAGGRFSHVQVARMLAGGQVAQLPLAGPRGYAASTSVANRHSRGNPELMNLETSARVRTE